MIKSTFFKVVCAALLLCASVQLNAATQTVEPGEDIQDAIDYVATNGGGTVTLAAGTHTITTSVKMKSNVTLQGEGDWESKLYTSENIKMIEQYSNGLENMTIQNLEIEGTNQVDGGGIQIVDYGDNHDNVNVINVYCHNTGWGVHIKGVNNVTIEDCLFEENGSEGNEYYAHNMYLRRCSTVYVSNSRFINSISSNGVNISYSTDLEFYNCEMSGNYFRGIRAANTIGFLVHDCIVTDNGHGSTSGGAGIIANSEGEATTDVDFRRNCVSNNASQGIYGVSGVTGVAYDNNSYGNDDDYSLPSGVSTSNNSSDSSVECVYDDGSDDDPSVSLSAVAGDGTVLLSWALTDITLSRQDVFRDTDSDESGRTMIAGDIGSGTSYTDNTAVNGTAYWYWVKATNTSGETINSNSASATPSEDAGTIDAFSQIEAEDFSSQSGIQIEDGDHIGYINDGDYILFEDVDFGDGAGAFEAYVSSQSSGGSIELRLGSVSGSLIGTCSVSSTGSWSSWSSVSCSVSGASDVQDLYLVFTGDDGYLFNMDWVQFTESVATAPEAGKTYYIDCAYWDLRLAADGDEKAYTTSTSTTGSNVEWVLTASSTTGYYYVDCNGGGDKPRIRTNQTEDADMQATTSAGSWTKWAFTDLGDDTYLFTTLDEVLPRLQINSLGEVKMVTTASTGTWETFTFTEVTTKSATISGEATSSLDGDLKAVKVYPNPTNDILTIANGEGASLEIYNILGALVYSQNDISSNFSVDVSDFKSGLLYVRLTNDGSTSTQKVIKK